jgi:hypothetical protein
VLNDFEKFGRSYLETGEDEADLETIISSMLEGQYSNPVDVFAFNATEEWAREVSQEVADEIRHRCDRQGINIPAHLEAFVNSHESRDQQQLTLRSSETMLRKNLVTPPEAAKAFVRDMRAFFKAKSQLMRDDIAARQVWLLKQQLPRWTTLPTSDVKELFLQLKDYE